MQSRYDEIRALGAEVLVVTMSRPEVVAAYLKMKPWPFPVVCDPERAAYRRFGLGHTSWLAFFRPSVLVRYLGLMVRGWRVQKINEGEDALQLGGDFVLDENRKVVFAYPSRVATDRPKMEKLVEIIRGT